MNNINIQGCWYTTLPNKSYLVNNFTETKTTKDWTFGGTNPTLNSAGVEVLTGTSPNITSTEFYVGPNDIVTFEFTLSLPTPSTATSGGGVYLGTKYGQTVKTYTYDTTNKKWTISQSSTTNPYFINSYNSSTALQAVSYILGTAVNIDDVPPSSGSTSLRAIQLTGTDTTTFIRSGYNSNSTMVINFSNPKLYYNNRQGLFENKTENSRVASYYIQANNFIEI